MKGLKIIPLFLVLLVCTYVGILFVEANRDEVTVRFGAYQAGPAALGLVVLTSILLGMLVAGILCSFELMVLVMQNRRLRRKGPPTSMTSTPPPGSIGTLSTPFPPEDRDETTEFTEARNTNRFTPL